MSEVYASRVTILILPAFFIQFEELNNSDDLSNHDRPLLKGSTKEFVRYELTDVEYGKTSMLEEMFDLGVPSLSMYKLDGEDCSTFLQFTESGAQKVTDTSISLGTTSVSNLLDIYEHHGSDNVIALLKELKERHTPLPWTNQWENSRKYLATKLLTM